MDQLAEESSPGRSAVRLPMTCERRDEGLPHGRVAVTCFERPLVPIGVGAGGDILTKPAGQRKRRPTVPGFPTRECHVQRDLPPPDSDQQIPMDVNQTVLPDDSRHLISITFA